jgi:outer membrane protein TolC
VFPFVDRLLERGDTMKDRTDHAPTSRRWAWRLGSLAGISIYLHATFVLLLAWVAVSHLSAGHGLVMAGQGLLLMVGVSIPLWRGKLRAGVNEARAMADMASADLGAMRRMIGGEATAARERVAAARERYLALRDSVVPRARQAIAPNLTAYAANQTPLVSAIEAAQALWEAQRELAMARAELGIAWARLRRTTGETP